MSGFVGDLNPRQEQTLKQFRENLRDALQPRHDDHFLLQFLRARCFDLKKTEEMFRRHLKFREEFPEDYFLNEYQPPPILIEHLLPPLLGYDKEGCPIRIIHVGHQDIRGILASCRRLEIRKCVTWFLDTDKRDMRRKNEETGKHIETRTFIFDLADLSLSQIYHRDVFDLVVSFLRLYECNYPENLKVAFIINTPPFFSWIFSLVKSILTEDTVKKLRIHGHSGWKEDFLRFIDAETLPVIYGGTRTDPDGNPKCPTLIREFYKIPKEQYLRNQSHLDPGEEGVVQATVGRRSKHTSAPLRAEKGARIEWEIECLTNDIRACLSFCDGGAGKAPVVVRMNNISNEAYGVERGSYVADNTGQYSLVLDNSYSILRSKNVLYRFTVTEITCIDSDILHELNEDCIRGE